MGTSEVMRQLLFQSLKGFWGGYSAKPELTVAVDLVSIPERVLGWLQLQYGEGGSVDRTVSIPERVLGWLQLSEFHSGAVESSLSVSIPERVLGWLQHD